MFVGLAVGPDPVRVLNYVMGTWYIRRSSIRRDQSQSSNEPSLAGQRVQPWRPQRTC